jgi:hypothetical protein
MKPGTAPEQFRQRLQATFTNFRRERLTQLMRPGLPQDLLTNFVNAPLYLRSASRGGPLEFVHFPVEMFWGDIVVEKLTSNKSVITDSY